MIKRAEVQVGDQILFTDPEGKLDTEPPNEGEGKVAISRFGYLKQLLDFSELRGKESLRFSSIQHPQEINEVYIRGEKTPKRFLKKL